MKAPKMNDCTNLQYIFSQNNLRNTIIQLYRMILFWCITLLRIMDNIVLRRFCWWKTCINSFFFKIDDIKILKRWWIQLFFYVISVFKLKGHFLMICNEFLFFLFYKYFIQFWIILKINRAPYEILWIFKNLISWQKCGRVFFCKANSWKPID